VPHTVDGGMGGLHLTVRLEPQYPDRAIAMAARDYGLAPSPLSSFSLDPQTQHNGLVLGYGNTAEETYTSAVRRIARLAQAHRKTDV
jgi:GntR family transcriptional regulator/MocR family aminotransferase